MTAYATRADLYVHGFARGSFTNPGRNIASVSTGAESLELDDHGFETDMPIVFRPEAGGSLPAPLVEGTTYYARRLTDSRFQVAATVGGAAIDLTTAGADIVVATEKPVEALLEFWSQWVDGFMPAHAVPFESPFPVVVVGLVASLTAVSLRELHDDQSPAVISAKEEAARALTRFAKGIPLRDAAATAAANLAVAKSAASVDPRGWDNGGLIP